MGALAKLRGTVPAFGEAVPWVRHLALVTGILTYK